MPVAAAASGVTWPATSPGSWSSKSISRVTPNRSDSDVSSLHRHVSVSIGHCRRMLLAELSLRSPVSRYVRYPDDVVAYATPGASGTYGS